MPSNGEDGEHTTHGSDYFVGGRIGYGNSHSEDKGIFSVHILIEVACRSKRTAILPATAIKMAIIKILSLILIFISFLLLFVNL
jgi:hypothetical protein